MPDLPRTSDDPAPEPSAERAPASPAHVGSAGLRHERTLASRQFHDGVFRNANPAAEGLQGGRMNLFGELLFGAQQRRPPAPLPVDRPHEAWATRPDSGFRVTWLGRSTTILELDGRRILTDPVFSERVSPVATLACGYGLRAENRRRT